MQDVNLTSRRLGSLSAGDTSKALLQYVLTIGAEYGSTVAELQ